MNMVWEDFPANHKKINACLSSLESGCDLLLLPEMFSTGFSMDSQSISQSMEGETVAFLRRAAAQSGTAIMGSIAVKENDTYYNRMLLVTPEGTIDSYDKRHLFRMSGENLHYRNGSQRKIFCYKGIRILPQICYDLRFPVWSRNVDNEYDLLVYAASWPASREEVWKTLLKARAIENQCYAVGVNRVGHDPLAQYTGESQVVDFRGNVAAVGRRETEDVIVYTLDFDAQRAFREKFPAWMDADRFNILP